MALAWLSRPGLAGGIDKSGERAGELLGLGFGSVEFGTVTREPLPGANPGLAVLIGRLLAVDRGEAPKTAIGIGLGLPPELPEADLADEWLAGRAAVAAAGPVADYLSLNLSAQASRRFLAPERRDLLLDALAALAAEPAGPPLALKLPVAAVAGLWPALVAAGFAQLTVVLPDTGGIAALADLRALGPGPAVVAVGGIRSAADRAAALAAGAAGVQVHRLFLAAGAATPGLLGGAASPENHEPSLALSRRAPLSEPVRLMP